MGAAVLEQIHRFMAGDILASRVFDESGRGDA